MGKVPQTPTPTSMEEFSIEIGDVNGVKLYETKKHLKKNVKNK
ncbi:hypothetical protein [Neobacillus cucumis]|jgi:hypothetical protein|nr:hypothetical protein [Neobacillus cucumis]MDR4946175.1 hypothetical protein [Neobacillus cucumis]